MKRPAINASLIVLACFLFAAGGKSNTINGIPATDPLHVSITASGAATDSQAVTLTTSSTTITLTGSTVQIRIVPATTGTTFYKVGSGTASATNGIPLTVGQITFDDTVSAGSRISLTGSGALLIQLTR